MGRQEETVALGNRSRRIVMGRQQRFFVNQTVTRNHTPIKFVAPVSEISKISTLGIIDDIWQNLISFFTFLVFLATL